MSVCSEEGREWRTVQKKKKKKGMNKKRKDNVKDTRAILLETESLSALEGQRIRSKIKESVEELRGSEFGAACLETIGRSLRENLGGLESSRPCPEAGGGVAHLVCPVPQDVETDSVEPGGDPLDCVCYGIGNFSTSVTSRYQLALLLLLLESLQVPRARCLLFDPLFSEWEREFLRELGMTVLKDNEEGKRAVDRPTLFYMIHCGKALYNNLLWRNWSPGRLAQITLIGNSFKGIEERLPSRTLQSEYTCIAHILDITEECALPASSRYMDVFNDTSLHHFPRDKLNVKPPVFWDVPAEPTYQECEDLEIIRNLVITETDQSGVK
uniref:SRR1-like protein n=1 Tax=Callorhinchus milii TaxID=7868 RepID=V9KVB6_CALMI